MSTIDHESVKKRKWWIVPALVFTSLVLGALFMTGLYIYSVDDEDCNDDPCEIASYSLHPKFNSVYHLVTLSSHPKNYCCQCTGYDPALVECNVIYLSIGINQPELDISHDSVALELARIFWDDSLNSNVDSLYLELENTFYPEFPHHECTVNYGISKNSLNGKYQKHKLEDFNESPDYKVLYEHFGTEYGGYYEANVFDVGVLVSHDYKNLDSLSLIIKHKYASMLNEKKIDKLELAIEIDEPYCELCLDQKHEFFYELTTKRAEASKKHFKP